MSDTTQLFMFAGVWAIVSLFVAQLPRTWIARIGLYLVLVGIPFGELPYGYIKFRSICKAETKVLTLKEFPPQRNVCVDFPFDDAVQEVLRAGFDSVEARGKSGIVQKYLNPSAIDRRDDERKSTSANYCITSVSNVSLPGRILRHDHIVRTANTKEIVARQSRFEWEGMWWQESSKPLLGTGGACAQDMSNLFHVVLSGSTKVDK